MADLQNYEIAILLMMYDEQLIGKAGYKATRIVRSKIKWQKISSAYRAGASFESISRRLVKMKLLSDDGKSMEVLYLDKLGVDFVVGYLSFNPNAMKDLEARMNQDR